MPTLTHLYDSEEQVRGVVAALIEAGYRREQISIVAPRAAVPDEPEVVEATPVETGAAVGGLAGAGAGLLAAAGAFAIPGVGPLIGLGALASALVGAAGGAIVGSLAGTLVEWGVDPEAAPVYEEGLRRGSSLVSIDVERGQEAAVTAILEAFHPVDITQRRREFEEGGWSPKSDNASLAPGSSHGV